MNDSFTALQELGDTTRLRVFLSLLGAKKNVSQITAELALAQPQVSYHLRRLKDVGLAVEEKEGRWVWYQANWQSDDRNIRAFIDLMARWAEDVGAVGSAQPALVSGSGESSRSAGGPGRMVPQPVPVSEEDEDRPLVERPKKPETEMEDFLL
jgi:DNA-binding transcriptional ArsR family regulator